MLTAERQYAVREATCHGFVLAQKLKGTQWDPENSYMIDFSNFWKFLN